jgi:hypothetical protein
MNDITDAIVSVAVAIIGLAMLAVIVGRNAQTSSVIKSMGDAFSSALKTAVSPVT